MQETGIYVLWSEDGQCLYVGRSKNMEDRVKTHARKKQFASVSYMPCRPSELRDKERKAIRRLKPAWNQMIPKVKYDKRSTLSVVLTGSDQVVIAKLRKRYKSILGVRLCAAEIIRYAFRELAKQQAK